MSNNESYDITSDTELQAAVRTETGYDATTLDDPDLTGLVDSAKRELALRTGVESFYDTRGVSVALLGLTCVKAKARVENQPVRTEDIGPTDATFRTTDGSSLQVARYEDMIEQGLSASTEVTNDGDEIRLTHTFFHG